MRAWGRQFVPVVIGVIVLVFGVIVRQHAMRSRLWPVAPGVVTESSLYGGRKGNSKKARIFYRYAVNGQTYRGDVVSFGRLFLDDQSEWVARYPQSAMVDVHYDPQDPGVSVLEPGLGSSPTWLIFGGLGLIAYGAWRGLR